jgi:histidine ammonia-lyase
MKTETIDMPLNARAVAAVAAGARLVISAGARQRIAHARSLVDVVVSRGIRAYGVNTGVGALCDTLVDEAQQRELSRNIVMSHACGVGDPLSVEQTRAIMACAINNFALGGSGVRPAIVECLLSLLNADLIPVVPRWGSIGYITLMSHIALVLVGAGEVRSADRVVSGREALELLGKTELTLEAKEGLSLVNGSPDTAGLACVGLGQLSRLLDWADVIAAMTFENIGHNLTAYSPQSLRFSASEAIRETGIRLTQWLSDSEIIGAAKVRTQDAMSLRAVPQVHGAVRECLAAGVQVVNRELASVTDNPIVAGTLEAPTVHSGAHAIATALALSLDGLVIAVAKIAAMSERRIDRLVNPLVSGLPAFLAATAGVSSGFMIAQYTALSLASENRRLAAPSSLDGGVSSGLQEDEIPHATTGALRLLKVIENFESILAIELLAAAQAYEFQAATRARATDRVYRHLREFVQPYTDVRPVAPDIRKAVQCLRRPPPGVAMCVAGYHG